MGLEPTTPHYESDMFFKCNTDVYVFFLSYSVYYTSVYNEGCLAPVTEAYLNSFCDGFTGQMLSLDQQCTLSYGPGSVRRTEPNSVIIQIFQSLVSYAVFKGKLRNPSSK